MEELRSKPQNHSFRTTQKENKQRQMASVRGREYLSTSNCVIVIFLYEKFKF